MSLTASRTGNWLLPQRRQVRGRRLAAAQGWKPLLGERDYYSLADESGRLVGYAKVTRDFSEKMEAQKALQKEVSERREAQHLLHSSEKSLRQLSLHLLRTQDEERRRIGRDLHDSLGQYLAVLKMKLESFATFVNRERRCRERAQRLHSSGRRFDQGSPNCFLSALSTHAGGDGSGIGDTVVPRRIFCPQWNQDRLRSTTGLRPASARH